MIEDNVKYGFCRGCNSWQRRDSLVATTIRFYGDGVDNLLRTFRVRLCQPCQEKYADLWTKNDRGESIEWTPRLYDAREIRASRELSALCPDIEYDPVGD